jgi:alkylation response protein AidB-like acyl-CoA dehydrogenase
MNLTLTEEQESFRTTTRRFLENEMPLSTVRSLYETVNGFDRHWWTRATELGWATLFAPEDFGGSGVSGSPTVDAVIVAEEMGRLVSPGPFLPTTVVTAALSTCGRDTQQAELLPDLLSGKTIAAWAHTEPGGRWRPEQLSTSASVEGDEIVLAGVKAYVECVGVADTILVTARTGEGITQVLVPVGSTPGVSVTRGRSIDITRRFGWVSFEGSRLPITAIVGEPGGEAAAVEHQLAIALALQCAEMVGVADRALEFTLEYGRHRFAFGRPIVSFQALKHRIADMAVWLEGSKAVADELATAVDERRDDTSILASVAKAYIGEHCLNIVDDCVQITGGIGVTWEHDIHLYSRRAIVDRAMFGTPEEHKERLVELIGAEIQS